MLSYYPPGIPRIEKHFAVDNTHQLYIEEYGNPEGIPVIVIHGGPGGNSNPDLARYFNPEKYRIILYDQRGSGKSIPRNCLINNTVENSIEDLEKIRLELKLKKPVLFGGSWGSTLALLYAERYPNNIRALILRGVYLAGNSAYMQEDSIAARTHPKEWIEFKKAVFTHNPEITRSYNELLKELEKFATNEDPKIWKPVAMALARWETINSESNPETLKIQLAKLDNDPVAQEAAWTMGRLEIFYKSNRFWLTENQILNDAFKLKNVPVYIVHGHHDNVCHPSFPQLLIDRLRKANINFLHVSWTDAGHAGTEPANIRALVEATNDFAVQFEPRETIKDTLPSM